MTSTLHFLPTERERILIERSSAHACRADLLEPEARFQNGVTDLDMARLMLMLERGTQLRRESRTGRWFPPVGSPLNGQIASKVVAEGIRTGLLYHVRGIDVLIPADVHWAAWDEGVGRRITRCRTAGENRGPKRVRISAEAVMVDCPRCLP
jgi:hypothetical protein